MGKLFCARFAPNKRCTDLYVEKFHHSLKRLFQIHKVPFNQRGALKDISPNLLRARKMCPKMSQKFIVQVKRSPIWRTRIPLPSPIWGPLSAIPDTMIPRWLWPDSFAPGFPGIVSLSREAEQDTARERRTFLQPGAGLPGIGVRQ